MLIKIEHFSGQYPQFNVALSSAEGKEPFITIKGCRIIEGTKGPFISWPATKRGEKWWQHVWASEGFAQAVMDEARKTQPKVTHGERQQARADSVKRDFQDSVPF